MVVYKKIKWHRIYINNGISPLTTSDVSGSSACSIGSFVNNWYSYNSKVLGTGSVVFTGTELNVTVAGGGSWYREYSTNNSYQIDANGNILAVYNCGTLPSAMWTITSYTDPNLYFTRNYGTDTAVTVQTSTNSGASWENSTSGVVNPRDIGSLAAA